LTRGAKPKRKGKRNKTWLTGHFKRGVLVHKYS